jgi:hypothetical protein
MTWFPDELLARTEELCAATPLHAGIRRAALRLEARGDRAGWDAPANVATVHTFEHHPATGQVRSRVSRGAQLVLLAGLEGFDGDPGAALIHLADVFEVVNRQYGPASGASPDGFEFYGYGFSSEGWATPPGAAADAAAVAAAERHELHLYPGRIEIRQVHLAGRDGLFWWVLRERGGPAKVVAALPESPLWAQTGRIPNALARMTNALAGSHAPVPDR